MKVSISHAADVRNVPKDVEEVHLTRPISAAGVRSLIKKCKNLKNITMSKTSHARLSKNAKKLIEANNICTAIVSERGNALSVPLFKIKAAIEMRRDHRPLREIEQVTGIPKSTIHYLEKYSKRKKVKSRSLIVYLR
ncbi:MAG: hypothetical protein N3F05_03450 [Candidatus Diapherotrites archaeon]|nr:hypothetical protein [Candidatus Diapherotrites archaeon]